MKNSFDFFVFIFMLIYTFGPNIFTYYMKIPFYLESFGSLLSVEYKLREKSQL